MPEGDTIYRAAAALHRALAARTVTRFESVYAHLARVDDQAAIAGQTVDKVWAEGKHLLMRFSGGQTLRTHMRMTGSWHIYPCGTPWRRPRRDMRILIETAPRAPRSADVAASPREPTDAGFVAVAFLVPVAELLDDRALARSPALRRLGPDLLDDAFDPAEARRRVRAGPDRSIAEIVLDQTIAAGAGNVYRSEVLFLSRLDPLRAASSVSDAELESLFSLTRKLMKANVGAGPSGGIVTYSGLRRTTGRSDPGQRLWVYDRRGEPCRRCGAPIVYRKLPPDARSVYSCPRCQR